MYINSAFQQVWDNFVTLTKSRYLQNPSHPIQQNQFSAKLNAGYQLIWIEYQAKRIVGPDLDPYCLHTLCMSFKLNKLWYIVRQYFHFVPELLEGTVQSNRPLGCSFTWTITSCVLGQFNNNVRRYTLFPSRTVYFIHEISREYQKVDSTIVYNSQADFLARYIKIDRFHQIEVSYN